MKPTDPSPVRWVMVAPVFLATAINYLDRQTLSVVAPVLIDQFHMSSQAYARVISAFMLAYTVANGSVVIGFGTMPLICAGILWALVSPIRPRLS
jgi:sugar phosphate permease